MPFCGGVSKAPSRVSFHRIALERMRIEFSFFINAFLLLRKSVKKVHIDKKSLFQEELLRQCVNSTLYSKEKRFSRK